LDRVGDYSLDPVGEHAEACLPKFLDAVVDQRQAGAGGLRGVSHFAV